MTGPAIRIYSVTVAVLCGGALAYGLDRQHAADAWQTQALQWQTTAQKTVAADKVTRKRMGKLVRRYNGLVHSTTASQKALLARMQSGGGGTIYRSAAPSASSSYSAPATVSSPAPVASPPAPTTHTS